MLISDKTVDGISIDELSPCSEKRVLARCDNCKELQELIWANYNRSQKQFQYGGLTYCRKCSAKINGVKRRGKPAHNKGKKLSLEKKGKNHSSWKGGQFISSDGYKMIYVGKTSNIGWHSYKKEHVVKIEQLLGRKLYKTEVVHHLDGNKLNNKVENLWVTSSIGHKYAHTSLQKIGYNLYIKGIIDFDKEKGIYFLKDNNENFRYS